MCCFDSTMKVSGAFFVLGFLIVSTEGGGLQTFLGKWESTDRTENTQAFADALNHADIHSKIFNEFSVDETSINGYHHKFSVPERNYVQDLVFKLGEEGQKNFNGTTYKYKYKMDGDTLKSHYQLPDRHDDQEFTLVNNELVKTYKVNNVTAKVWFKKI